jgi:hypothetical protein
MTQDHRDKKHVPHAAHSNGITVKEAERRGGDRHVFTASADVVELSSGARFSTRTTDLGPGGCFVDTTNPFPTGSILHVKLHKGKTTFETSGMVVYSQHGLGMGIAFNDLTPERRTALEAWLADITGDRHTHEVGVESGTSHHAAAPKPVGSQKTSLVRLVQLLIGKGMLTEAEGASVLIDPVL